MYLPISVTKITNYELEKNSKNYTVEEAIEVGTQELEKQLEQEIGNNKNILDKSANIEKTEEYVNVIMTYEVLENIGMQEKFEKQTEDIQ